MKTLIPVGHDWIYKVAKDSYVDTADVQQIFGFKKNNSISYVSFPKADWIGKKRGNHPVRRWKVSTIIKEIKRREMASNDKGAPF